MTNEPLFRIAILTEAGLSQGYGHLTRCCALYDAFDQLGTSLRLLVRGDAPAEIVEARSFKIVEWANSDAVLQLLGDVDAAIIDSYEADASVYDTVAATVRIAAYLDDSMRIAHPEGLTINASPAAIASSYPGTALCGPDYLPLRRAFWDFPGRKAPCEQLGRVLVVLGGTDALGLREPVAAALEDAFPQIEFDVVRESRAAQEMRDSMLAADAAVSAAGQTLYELARTGTPTVAIAVADNQLAQARALETAGALVFAGSVEDEDILSSVVRGLSALADRDARTGMSRAGATLADGRGALRLARAVLRGVLDQRVCLTPVTASDERAILELASDPVVRANSFSSGAISPAAHHEWFAGRLADTQGTLLLLAQDGDTLAGQVRFDLTGCEAVVSIALAPRYRGLGWGSSLLNAAIPLLVQERPQISTLVAYVKPENEASIRLFESVGFETAVSGSSGSGEQDHAVRLRRVLVAG